MIFIRRWGGFPWCAFYAEGTRTSGKTKFRALMPTCLFKGKRLEHKRVMYTCGAHQFWDAVMEEWKPCNGRRGSLTQFIFEEVKKKKTISCLSPFPHLLSILASSRMCPVQRKQLFCFVSLITTLLCLENWLGKLTSTFPWYCVEDEVSNIVSQHVLLALWRAGIYCSEDS